MLAWEPLSSKSAADLEERLLSSNSWEQSEARRALADAGEPFTAVVRPRLLADRLTRPSLSHPGLDAAAQASARSELAALARSPNPRMRVEALRALARLQDARSAEIVPESALNGTQSDSYDQYAAWLSINDLAEPWMQSVLSGKWKVNSPERERQLEFALDSIVSAIRRPGPGQSARRS